MAARYFLTIEGGKMVAYIDDAEAPVEVTNEMLDGLDPNKVLIMASSSIDFPTEFTQDAEVIAMCERLTCEEVR